MVSKDFNKSEKHAPINIFLCQLLIIFHLRKIDCLFPPSRYNSVEILVKDHTKFVRHFLLMDHKLVAHAWAILRVSQAFTVMAAGRTIAARFFHFDQ